jgi:serine/threonine-protein kinase
MSVVWRGHDDVLDRPVAIKVLAPGFADDQAFRDRMRREARAAARLSHPHVGSLYDFGEAPDGRPYMVMELIAGQSLADLLRDGPLPCARALAVGAQVAAALAEVHARGLVHRDVKPGNVMVTETGAKLVDFGISAMADEPLDEPPATLLGTPAYVAPEVVTGCPAGTAADVYSLGVLVYRALTGHLPWPVETPSQVLRAHVLAAPQPLPPIDGLSLSLVRLTLRCLAKDPARRPTCAELAPVWWTASRAAARTPEPTRTIPLPAVPLLRRHRRRVAMAACTVLGLFGFTASAAFSTRHSQSDLAAPQHPAAAPAPPPACHVDYQLRTDDGERFAGTLTVRNTGAQPVPASTLTFAFPADQRVAGAAFTQRGPKVAVSTAALAPGGTRTFTFTGSYAGTNAMPTGFALGATACDTRTVGVVARPTGGDNGKHGKPKKPHKD